jgi:hypothetical protein
VVLRAAMVFTLLGAGMNTLGHLLQIAAFATWWQVLTCYLGYVLPLALWLRHKPWHGQLMLAAVAFIPLELVGYALGTSIIYPGNIIERLFGVHNFSLVMVVVVTPLPWLGNVMARILDRLVDDEAS